MTVLVAYGSKYGSTQGIAERIATTLRAGGFKVDLEPVQAADELDEYDAFVIGSAAYMGSWLKEAREFVHSNRDVLVTKPVWIFSSGPIGTDRVNAKGQDVVVASEPKEFTEFAGTIRPVDQKVFWGALDRSKLRGVHRLFNLAPASERVLIEGDFREWDVIDEWARSIARNLSPATLVTAQA